MEALKERKMKMKKDYTKYSEPSKETEIVNTETVTNEEVVTNTEETEVITMNGEPVTEESWVAQMEDDGKVHVRPVVDGEVQETPVEKVITQEELQKETDEEEKPLLIGIVKWAGGLNIRKEPKKDSEIVVVVANGSEMTIDEENSTDTFYKVQGSCKDVLFEGYCMKEFVEIK